MLLAATGARRRTRSLDLPPPPYTIPTTRPYNAPGALTIPTYDGSGQAVHPDVVDMRDHPWNGYRFWMGMTPYPYSNDDYENPSILASNDAVTWVVPTGLTNPIYPFPGGDLWNADTDLSHDPTTGEMVLIFLGGGLGTMCARSSDGVTWTTTGPLSFSAALGSNSPAMLREDDGSWSLWRNTGSSGGIPRTNYKYTAAQPEGPWTLAGPCTGLGAYTWHHDVIRHDGRYLKLIKDNQPYQEWGATAIFTATSSDGLAWTQSAQPIIQQQGWARSGLYRPTFTIHENGTHARVWYCGNANGVWRIGLTHVPLTEWPPSP